MFRYIYILLFFFTSLVAGGQDIYIRGKVKSEAGTPVFGANIRLKSSGYLYKTDSDGKFAFPARKGDSLRISHDEFLAADLPVNKEETEIILKPSGKKKTTTQYKLVSKTPSLSREIQQQWFTGDESYASLVENGKIRTTEFPSTGLSLHVDRASYSNVRRFLSSESEVPPDAVRTEELLNYFNFDYTEPGKDSVFGLRSALTSTPWNPSSYLLFTRINSRKLNVQNLPPGHLVFLIDVSASMDIPSRLPVLKSAFRSLVHNLRSIDSVSIVVYGAQVAVLLDAVSGNDKEIVLRCIDSIGAGGSTPGESGILMAYQTARKHFIKGGNNRIILATDGDFNVGLKTDEELEELVVSNAQTGIYLTCLGIGTGNYKDSRIQSLARKGNGNFAYIDNYAEGEKVLLKEFTQTLFTVADNATFSISFDSSQVKEYRLIGFDNKAGAMKDKAAELEGGEVGPANSILIAYEIYPKDSLAIKKGLRLNYNISYRLPETGVQTKVGGEHTVRCQSFSSLSTPYRFASSVLMFGSLLRNSRYVTTIAWNDIIKIAAASVDRRDFLQMEFINLVQLARNIYSKKKKKEKD